MNTYTSRRFPTARRRGSVLIVALIFSLIIGISLVSFLQLATNATKISYRTHYLGVAMNAAETGLEQAMWEMNDDAGAWTNWTAPGAAGAHRRTFDLGTVEGGATAKVNVYAQTGSSGANWMIARSIITPPKGSPIEKWVKVTLKKRSLGAIGGLGKDGIVSSGNQVVMGSWNSDPDGNPSTPPIPYSSSVANDEMTLATVYVNATLSSGNADINGSASVGANTTDAIEVGAQGYIGPFGTANGVKDPDSISANFSADIPVPEVPTGKTYTDLVSISSATTLPRSGDTAQDGVYYYTVNDISLNGSSLVISPGKEVVINVTKTSGDAISVGGNGGAIKVAGTLVTNTSTGAQTYSSGKLKLYTAGDLTVSGQGVITNEITTQNYTPATTYTTYTKTTTTISNVTEVKGKGQQKDTVIGWDYTQTITVEIRVDSGATTSTSTSRTYQTLIASGGTQPTASSSSTTTSSSGATPESTADTGSYVGQADNLRIYGTRTNAEAKTNDTDLSNDLPQQFKISGNGSLSAVVDAINAEIEAKGGGNSGFIYGSLVGKKLKFTGNDCFYYDESLAASEDDARLGIDSWDELVSYVDRNAYASYMNF